MSAQHMRRLCLLLALFGMIWTQTASAGLTNRYVVKNNPGAAAPYDSLANAAGDIQTAINYACTEAGSTVLVAVATYDTGGTVAGSMTNRVYISKTITVRSIDNDPMNTIIKGAWHPVTTNGTAAIRCVYMVAGATLGGFTLTNGATIAGGNGGGVYSESATATISNCVITGCSADNYGGGAYNGTLSGCKVKYNTAGQWGGGIYLTGANNLATNCDIVGNAAFQYGGGVFVTSAAQLWNSRVIQNRTTRTTADGGSGGGGVVIWWAAGASALIANCEVISNRTSIWNSLGGGVRNAGIMYNCLVAYNSGPYQSSAVYVEGTVENCTIINNICSPEFSVVSFAPTWGYTIRNSIIYNNGTNIARQWYSDNASAVIRSSCVSHTNKNSGGGVEVIIGTSNITNNPMFIGYSAGNYRLQASSPCINTGTNQAWMTGKADLDGRIRIRYGTVDMGAYEVIYDGTIYKFR